MNKRGVNQHFKRYRPLKVMIISWLGVVLSLLLLIPAGSLLTVTLASFRPCSINNAGLTISSCGKSSVDITDILLLVLFAGVVLIIFSAVVHALRMSRRTA